MAGELTIVGMGMIGASFALAARAAFSRITVLDPDDAHVAHALANGMADARVSAVPASAEAVLLACPSDHIADWVMELAAHPGTVFDCGSVKGAIIDELLARAGGSPANYVPSHPIAGLEQSGPAAASGDLFAGKLVILTPVGTTDPERLERVRMWWAATGASVELMDAHLHDAVYARTSHLPHLIAFAYLLGIGEDDLPHTGGGFRDFSRIGGSDPQMWTAIFDKNRSALLAALDTFQGHVGDFRQALEAGDLDRCRALIAAARTRREHLP
ncbi:MAG TPA: prephenate dehydrogenase/arogenate dehydrogenase family protein [Pseudomonadales bacterium]